MIFIMLLKFNIFSKYKCSLILTYYINYILNYINFIIFFYYYKMIIHHLHVPFKGKSFKKLNIGLNNCICIAFQFSHPHQTLSYNTQSQREL